MTPFSSHSQTHTEGIDVLRGVAILMVVVFHAFGGNFGDYVPWDGWRRDFAQSPSGTLLWCYPVTYGWAGVALFFVISGFCIHYSFLRAGQFGIGPFLWRRFWRIYPAYFCALVFFTIFLGLDLHAPGDRHQFLAHALLTQNFHEDTFFTINPAFWSIATEVQLYLLYPLLLALRARFGIGNCFLIALALGGIWRVIVVAQWGLPDRLIAPGLTSPFMTWSDWTLGALLAERFVEKRPLFARPLRWLGIFIALLVVSSFYKPLTIFGFSLAAAASAVLLEMALAADWRRRRKWVLSLGFLGGISYSLYLWHQPLLSFIPPALHAAGLSNFWTWVACGGVLIAIAYASFHLVEARGIKLGADIRRDFAGRANRPR